MGPFWWFSIRAIRYCSGLFLWTYLEVGIRTRWQSTAKGSYWTSAQTAQVDQHGKLSWLLLFVAIFLNKATFTSPTTGEDNPICPVWMKWYQRRIWYYYKTPMAKYLWPTLWYTSKPCGCEDDFTWSYCDSSIESILHSQGWFGFSSITEALQECSF